MDCHPDNPVALRRPVTIKAVANTAAAMRPVALVTFLRVVLSACLIEALPALCEPSRDELRRQLGCDMRGTCKQSQLSSNLHPSPACPALFLDSCVDPNRQYLHE